MTIFTELQKKPDTTKSPLRGWPRSNTQQIWVPHLRDSLIVAKVGHRAERDPLSELTIRK
jgi:hypothetical protein